MHFPNIFKNLILKTMRYISKNFYFKKVYVVNKTVSDGELFAGQVIVVLGGTGGIGRAIVEKLINSGASVICCGRDRAKLDEIRNEMSSEHLHCLKCDIADNDDVVSLEQYILKDFRQYPDIVVNCAAIIDGTQFENVTSEIWDKISAVNSKAAFFTAQLFIRGWLKKPSTKPRKLLFVSSQAAYLGATYPYRLSKWDMVGLTEGLAKRYAHKGIIVNSVAPGIVLTDMQRTFKTIDDNYASSIVPMQRFASPTEVAELVIFLASDRCNFITGETIRCDGGYCLR